MTALLDRPSTGRSAAGVLPSAWVAGAIAAVQAAAGSLVVVLVPVVAAWVVTTGSGPGGTNSPWLQVVRLALAVWLLAQHVALEVPGGTVALVPLGLTAVPLAAAWFAGRRLARGLDPNAEKIEAGASRARRAAVPWSATAAMTLTYAALAAGAGWLATTDVVRPVLWQAAVGPAVVCLVGGWLGASSYCYGGAVAGLRAVLRVVPDLARGWFAPAMAALGLHLAGAAVVLVACLALGAARVVDIARALDAGLVGGLVLTLAQAVFVPNLVAWVAAAVAGPGFAIGAGTSVSPAASTLGPLPAVPVLAALPDPGPLPTPVLAVLLVPFVAGAVAGALLLRRSADGPVHHGRFALVGGLVGMAALAGAGLGVLAWLSGGAAGPGRLAVVGPQPLQVGAVFAVEVLAGGLVTFLVRQAAPSLADAGAAGVAAAFGRLRGGYRRRP